MSKHTIKLAVCDDLQNERENILAMLHKYMDIHDYLPVIDEYDCGETLLAADILSYDLIILDIYMGELNGIQTAQELMNRKTSAKIIFCSTSNAFAAESYDVNALRYLTKPVSEERLFQTLDRFFQAYTAMQTLTFKNNRIDESILLSDVIWIEAARHKCILHTTGGDFTTTTPFSRFCEELDAADFIKPIRYALVSLCQIAAVPSNELKLLDGTVIPISRELRQSVKDIYMDYKMKKLLKKGDLL